MKKKIYILLSLGVISCSSNNNSELFNINGQFTLENSIDCSSVSITSGCVSRIWFKDESTSQILYEGDIILSRNYQISKNIITTEKQLANDFELSFKIIDETTIKRIQDNAIFLKEED